MKHKFFALLLAVMMLLSVMPAASAHEVPDLSRNGTITFQISWEGSPLDGGEFLMYRVGDIAENDGNFGFVPVDALTDSNIVLDNIEDPALAMQLARLAEDAGIEAAAAALEDGKAIFEDVEPGLYVVVQSQACPGFAKMNPFLISMPHYADGVYETEIVAMPKVPLETAPTEPTRPTEPTKPTEPTLPQTGQLNWPVPLLASGGLAFFALGWLLCFGRKRESDET